MVTIYHRSCHTHRIARTRPATPNASSVTLQELIQLAYACGLSRARALPVPTPLAVFLWRDLHSVRHPSTSHPHHHHGTRLDSTLFPERMQPPTQHGPCCAYDSNSAVALLLAVSLAASPITPLPSHQTACKHVSHICRAAVPHLLLCDEDIAAHRAVPLLRIHRIDLSACSRSASQYHFSSSYPLRLSC